MEDYLDETLRLSSAKTQKMEVCGSPGSEVAEISIF